ncbi:PAS domain-containing sensor histidine kinase [Urechidicola croceus]|uniref:histidine kinase n=1 Tax=Urechidicola croceus TaxID=1850246 RepID=A0A1D8P7X2_9FLAO|nr:PAS domain-containing sensor histidine kinase [Urechidicola croceus]AOW20674.1 PAS domain-containing sensor histidine kinase [Urechidicola croceus]
MFEQNQEVFNLLFEAISEGVVVVDIKQNIVIANTSAEEMFGYDKNELNGEHLNVLIPNNYHSGHGHHFKGFMKDREKRRMGLGRDVNGLKKNGTIFPIEAGLNPFEVAGKFYVMAIVIDITERKNYTENLEQIVKERTKQLEEALNKEKELNELKTKFLSLVSHEFKTPLSGILTSAILLEKYKLTEHQERRDKHIKTITDKVQYLNNILSDFLSLEKLETGKVNYSFKTFNLSKIVNEVVYNANMLLKEGQKINYPENIEGVSMQFDEKIMELALSNLVHNAIKYSPENSIIDIVIEQDKTTTIFKVKDEGIGIPKNEQKNIFNRYFRAENATLTQGTGIGLNIVKNHIENLGGTIDFESEENKGSIFTITLPNSPIK